MCYKPGDYFLNGLLEDLSIYGTCLYMWEDTKDYFRVRRIPIGGYYA